MENSFPQFYIATALQTLEITRVFSITSHLQQWGSSLKSSRQNKVWSERRVSRDV